MPLAARILLFVSILVSPPAHALIGGQPAPANIAAQTALIVSTRGASCTGTVLTRDLVLTAAHCVAPKSDYAIVVFEVTGPRIVPASRIELHPRFDPDHFRTRKPTPDLALIKVSQPLPATFQAARLARDGNAPKAGDSFLLAGYGVTAEGEGASAGKLNTLSLPAIGNTIDDTGVIMVRLQASGGKSAGACTGDSGGPVYRGNEVAAVIGWSTGRNGNGCGSVTGATLVAKQLDWIAKTAQQMGSSLGK